MSRTQSLQADGSAIPLKGEISPLTIASPSLGALAAPRQQLEPDAP